MWEAEIRRITVPDQGMGENSRDSISTEKKPGVVVCLSSHQQQFKVEGSQSRQAWTKNQTLSPK
jgi:hypothetical protein